MEPCLAAPWVLTPRLSLAEGWGCKLTQEAPGEGVEGALEVLASWGVEAGCVLGGGFILLVNGCSQIPLAIGHSTPCGGRWFSQTPPRQSLTLAASGLGSLVPQSAALTRPFWPRCGPLRPQNCVAGFRC